MTRKAIANNPVRPIARTAHPVVNPSSTCHSPSES